MPDDATTIRNVRAITEAANLAGQQAQAELNEAIKAGDLERATTAAGRLRSLGIVAEHAPSQRPRGGPWSL